MYNEALWKEWAEKESANYKYVLKKGKSNKSRKYLKKGYTHFDQRIWFPNKMNEIQKLISDPMRISKYEFFPFLKMLIKTPRYKYQSDQNKYDLETKIRPISFAAHYDSLILGYYSFALTRTYEDYIKKKHFDECVLAYRSDLGDSNVQFAKRAFDEVKRRGECTAIALDITGYFDNIDHLILREKWEKVIDSKLPPDQEKIFNVLTKYNYVNKINFLKHFKVKPGRNHHEPNSILDYVGKSTDKTSYKMRQIRKANMVVTNKKSVKGRFKGIPQGSAISALLSNIYLIDYDKIMYEKSLEEGFYYRRYCDDIIIVCDSDKAAALQEFAINLISKQYELQINSNKVDTIVFKKNMAGIIRSFSWKRLNKSLFPKDKKEEQTLYRNLQYLGFEFNGQEIYIRSTSLSRYFRKMKARVQKTVKMAYSPNGKSDRIFKEQLFHRYSHLGKRNFISYAYNSAKPFYLNALGEKKEGMNSPAIRKQVSRHFKYLINDLVKANVERYQVKAAKNSKLKIKIVA